MPGHGTRRATAPSASAPPPPPAVTLLPRAAWSADPAQELEDGRVERVRQLPQTGVPAGHLAPRRLRQLIVHPPRQRRVDDQVLFADEGQRWARDRAQPATRVVG